MNKLKTIFTAAAVTVITFASLAFTGLDAKPALDGDGDPDTEIFYYYYVAPGGGSYGPYDPDVNYGCNFGPYPCIIRSNVPLGPDPATVPYDAVIDVIETRFTP